ncbi:MAG: hypothetical protein CL875_05740 [Dehalococcoidales bacterium]|nr:hypothetical protein [Dehalococcoidales bacterium]
MFIRDFLLKSAEIINTVTAVFLMGIVYYVFLTPFSLVYRVVKRDRLLLKRVSGKQSYFVVRDHTYNASDMEKM